MRTHLMSVLILSLCASIQTGCSFTGTLQKVFDHQPPGYVNGTENVDEKWTATAGKEGRGNRSREMDPDSWWGLLQSAKSRDIERNLGYDHPIDQ